MNIKRKLIYSTFFSLILLLAAIITGLFAYRSLMATSLVHEAIEKEIASLQMFFRGINESILTEGTPYSIEIAEKAIDDFDDTLRVLISNVNDKSSLDALTQKIHPQWMVLKDSAEPFLQTNSVSMYDEALMVQYGEILSAGELLIKEIRALDKKGQIEHDLSKKRILYTIAIILLTIIVTMFLLQVDLYRSIAIPINKLRTLMEGMPENGDEVEGRFNINSEIISREFDNKGTWWRSHVLDVHALALTFHSMMMSINGHIKKQKQANEALGESEERYRAVIQTAMEAIIVADNSGNINSWNRGAQTIFGYGEEEVLGNQLTILIPERFRDKHTKGMEKFMLTGEASVIGKTVCFHGLRKDGSEFPMELSLTSWKAGGEVFFTGVISDITERVCMEEMLKKSATTDKLTQAYNRTKYDEIIAGEFERAERYQQLLSIVLLDIDNFKEVNDTYGHIAGDTVLNALADTVRKNKRGIDHFIRWGGEEFMLVASGTGLEGAKLLAERVRKAIESYKFDTVGKITVSLGVTQFRQGDTEESLIKRADDALYEAKRAGKNQVVIGT